MKKAIFICAATFLALSCATKQEGGSQPADQAELIAAGAGAASFDPGGNMFVSPFSLPPAREGLGPCAPGLGDTNLFSRTAALSSTAILDAREKRSMSPRPPSRPPSRLLPSPPPVEADCPRQCHSFLTPSSPPAIPTRSVLGLGPGVGRDLSRPGRLGACRGNV